jgi:uncharacterized protein DUF6542
VRAERSDAGRATGRGYPSPRAGASASRSRADEGSERQHRSGRPPERRAPDPRERRDPHGAGRAGARHLGEFHAPVPPADGRRAGSPSTPRTRPPSTSGRHRRGAFALVGLFLLTLAGAAADSVIGLGLGMITLVALTAGTVVAALMVRRRDLLSVLVAPPLVFVAVAVVNIGLAPSASLNPATLATLLVRGFPAMGIATAAGVVVWLFRLVSRR